MDDLTARVWVVACSPEQDPRALGGAVAQEAVADLLGLAPAEVVLGRETGGRPVVTGRAQGRAGVSVTHTDGLVAVAVTSGAALVGIDAERLRPVRAAGAIAGRHFHPAESAVLAGLREPALSAEFLRMWCLKEAHGKALGHGVAMSLSTCRTTAGTVLAAPPPGGGRWRAGVRTVAGEPTGHVLALVIATAGGDGPSSRPLTTEIHHGRPGAPEGAREQWLLSP